jgi:YYY domain-containing protein
MALAFNLFLEPDGKGVFVFGRGWRLVATLGTTALILGGLFTMNGWDFPTYVGLALVCIALQQWLAHNARFRLELVLDIFIAGGIVTALSFLLYLPFYLTFISPSQGIGVVGPADRSPLRDEVLIYGLFAFMFLSLLVASVLKQPLFAWSSATQTFREFEQSATRRRWMGLGFGGILLFLLLGFAVLVFLQNSTTFVVAASIALVAVVLLFYHVRDRSHAFALLLGAVAFSLVALCEIFFLKDVFASDYPRMNTVFKFYFQAWALLSISSGAGLYFILESFRPEKTTRTLVTEYVMQVLWGMSLLALLICAMVYPLVGTYARSNHYLQRTNSLDGLAYLQTDPANPGDYAAIRWLNANVSGNPVIIEAIGPDYSNYARISAFTGLPTPMGWIGHEYQWRVNWLNSPLNEVEFQRRESDIDLIYTSTDMNVVLSVMAHYHAEYLYVGPLEHQKYLKADLQRFAKFMQVVYNANGVTIYKVR